MCLSRPAPNARLTTRIRMQVVRFRNIALSPTLKIGASRGCVPSRGGPAYYHYVVLCMVRPTFSCTITRLPLSERLRSSSDASSQFQHPCWRSLHVLPSDLWKKLVIPAYRRLTFCSFFETVNQGHGLEWLGQQADLAFPRAFPAAGWLMRK